MSEEPVEVVEDPEEEHEEEERLDPELAARRAAAMSFIRRYGDPVLKSRATPVDRFDDSLRTQVARMAALMNDALGVGLAAPQVRGPQPLHQRHAHRGGRGEHARAVRQLFSVEREAEARLADQPRRRLVARVALARDGALVARAARGARVDLDLVEALLARLVARA